MKISTLFLTLFTTLCLFRPVHAHNEGGTIENAVLKPRADGKMIVVQPIITGAVSLYRQAYKREEIDVLGIPTIVTRFRYFIGNDQIEEISRENYRDLVRKHLTGAPELHRKLGRLGFRYENVPSMVIYYNRHKGGQTMAMKYDLQKTSTLMMQELPD